MLSSTTFRWFGLYGSSFSAFEMAFGKGLTLLLTAFGKGLSLMAFGEGLTLGLAEEAFCWSCWRLNWFGKYGVFLSVNCQLQYHSVIF